MIGSIAMIAQQSGGGLGLLVSLGLMAAIFYFLLIRPQQRRMRQQRALMASLDVGEQVVTIGGIHGTIRSIEDDAVMVEVAPGVELRFTKGAIARTLPADQDEYEDEETGSSAAGE